MRHRIRAKAHWRICRVVAGRESEFASRSDVDLDTISKFHDRVAGAIDIPVRISDL
jgi:hypothetical protein